jgi:hypothetical protein
VISYITVLTAQLQAIQARQQLAEAMLTQSTDLVKLYKALGGGWEDARGDPAISSVPAGDSPSPARSTPAIRPGPPAPAPPGIPRSGGVRAA